MYISVNEYEIKKKSRIVEERLLIVYIGGSFIALLPQLKLKYMTSQVLHVLFLRFPCKAFLQLLREINWHYSLCILMIPNNRN